MMQTPFPIIRATAVGALTEVRERSGIHPENLALEGGIKKEKLQAYMLQAYEKGML